MREKQSGHGALAVIGRRALSAILALSFLAQSAAFAADTTAYASEDLSKARAPEVTVTGTAANITSVQVIKGGANGQVLSDLKTNPKAFLLERGEEYTLSITVHKTTAEGLPGYVRLRFGNESTDGTLTANGLKFQNPPGALFSVGTFNGHTYLDAVTVRTDAANPTYGTKPSTYNGMADGVFVYREKATLPKDNEVTFVMQFSVDDVGYDGSGWLTDGLQLQTGDMVGGAFAADATLTATLPVEPKPELKLSYQSNALTGTLGGISQTAQAILSEKTGTMAQIYDSLEFDVYYPVGASIPDDNFGFSTAFAITDSTRGKITKSGDPTTVTVDGTDYSCQHFTVSKGYMANTVNPSFYYALEFPSETFTGSQGVVSKLCNMKLTFTDTQGKQQTISVTDADKVVTYTLADPSNDSTTMSAANRTTGEGLYNITGVTDTAGQTLTSLGSCSIQNKVDSTTPFEKTYEAQFNTTNTAAAITYITVPLGNKNKTDNPPVVQLTGKKENGTTETVTVENPLSHRLRTGTADSSQLNGMVFKASDYGFTCFTAVKAEIGKLQPQTNTCSWTSNYDLTANLSGSYGYFTTDEPGIVVKNTYRLYNTDPSCQQYSGGDLSTTSQAVSTNVARAGFVGTTPTIRNEAGKTATAVYAGESVSVSGTVYPYCAALAEGYRTSNVAASLISDKAVYGTTSFVTDPVLLVTLPAGMTLDTTDMAYTVYAYSTLTGLTTKTPLDTGDYTVENITYMNKTGDGANLYRVTFPGLVLGYMVDTDASVPIRNQLSYTVKLKTSKSLETKTYYIQDLLRISSANGLTALPYASNRTSLGNVFEDKYGINGGSDIAAVLSGNYAGTGFGVQQQAEVNINNAVTVETDKDTWLGYDATDPNSVLMMGRKTNGQYRLRITNTSDLAATNVSVLVPLPKKGESLGKVFMYDDAGTKTFGFTMDVDLEGAQLDGFTAQYVTLKNNVDLWDSTVTDNNLEFVDTESEAEAILLTLDSAESNETYQITLNYSVDESEDSDAIGQQNIFRNIFRYTVDKTTYSGLGSYVACEIAKGTLTGTAFADDDRDGVKDAGETPLAGVNVVVKDVRGKVTSTTTDTAGRYSFTAIREENVSVTYDIGTNTEYRFNVPVSGLTPAANKKSAVASYAALPDNAERNIPLSTCWTLTYDGNRDGTATAVSNANATLSGVLPAPVECDPSNNIVTAAVKPDSLALKYHAFVSWNTKPDGSGVTYNPGAQITMTGDLTLYAQWEYATYTAYLDYRGATENITTTQFSAKYGEKYFSKLPPKPGETAPKKPGYEFRGWSTNATANQETGSVLNTGAWCNWSGDTTLYAMWKALSGFTVTYDTGGSEVADRIGLKWTDTVLPTDDGAAVTPTRTGYTFDRWSYEGAAVADDATYGQLAKTDETQSITLTALWTANSSYTVSYDLNVPADATAQPAAIAAKTNVSWTQTNLLPTAPTLTGYAFTGWTYSGKDVTSAMSYGDVCALAGDGWKEQGSVTLIAQWTKVENKKVIHYNTDGGTSVSDRIITGTTSESLIPDKDPTKPGSAFGGWKYGTIEITESTRYDTLVMDGSSEITLTAQWTPKTYTIAYDCSGAADVTAPAPISKTWNEGSLISDDASKLNRPGYTLSGWTYNGATVNGSSTVSALIPSDIAADTGTELSPTYTLTLIPVWTERTYNVVYNTDGGTAVATQSGILYTAKNFTTASKPTKTGYTFSHWEYVTTTSEGATTTTVTSETTIADLIGQSDVNTINLTASYTENNSYTVRYDTTGGTPDSIPDAEKVKWTDAVPLPSEDPTKAGYTFAGWSSGRVTNVTETTTYAQIAETEKSSVTLVATWEVQAYDIIYKDAGSGEFTGSYPAGTAVPDKYSGTTVLLPTPTKSGYRFGGWYTDSACTGSSITMLTGTYTDDITLYAKWVEIKDITGLVKIVYGEQTEQQKARSISLILQRRVGETGTYEQVATQTVSLEEGSTGDTLNGYAISSFSFADMPAADASGSNYTYRVTTNAANYALEYNETFGQTGDSIYNLLLTYTPDTFTLNLKVAAESMQAADRPQAVRVRVLFNPVNDTFTGTETIYTSAELKTENITPSAENSTWIYITEHDNAYTTLTMTDGTATGEYAVNKAWNDTGATAYYQFVIDAYQLPDDTRVSKGGAGNPYTAVYGQPCAHYVEGEPATLNVTIKRGNTVTFDLQGGTASGTGVTDGTLASQTVGSGDKVPAPTATITKTGYELEGWYTSTAFAETDKWDFATSTVTGNTTLYAHWTPNTYTITLNNGEGVMDGSVQAIYGAALPTITIPTKTNMAFAGYYTAQGGTGTCYYDAAGTAQVNGYTTAGELTLYAHWAEGLTISGTATIYYGDEDGSTPRTVTVRLERRIAGSTGDYETVATSGELTFGETSSDPKTATVTYSFANQLSSDSAWQAYEYRVNADIPNYKTEIKANGDGKLYDLEFTFLSDNFLLPISVDASAITTKDDRPTAVNVQVTYNPMTVPPSGDYDDSWPAVGQLGDDGYITLSVDAYGKANGSCSVQKTTTSQGSEDSCTSYYQIRVVSYEYTVDGETVTVTAEQGPFFVSGYGDYGHYDNSAGDPSITGVSAVVDRTYQVCFVDDDGYAQTIPVSQSVARGGYATDPSSDVTAEGYCIAGWYKNDSDETWDFANDAVTENITLHAKWEAATNSIYFYEDVGNVSGIDYFTKPLAYGAAFPTVTPPERQDFVFTGYYDDFGTCYYNADGTPRFDVYSSGTDLRLYAKWVNAVDVIGKVKVNYTYTIGQGADEETVVMPDPQRPGSVKVFLQRRTEGAEDWTTVADQGEQVIYFENFQGEKILSKIGAVDFEFTDLPETNAEGVKYEYRVTSETVNYKVIYGVTLDEDTLNLLEEGEGIEDSGADAAPNYNIELQYAAENFDLSMTVDARGLDNYDELESVDLKVAFIWYQPTGAFDGVVNGNPTATPDGKPDPHKWRYPAEYFVNMVDGVDAGVTRVRFASGTAAATHSCTMQGLRSGDTTVPTEDADKVVPYYYQFVIAAYHLKDGTVIQAGSSEDPFLTEWDKLYATKDDRSLTITLSQKPTGGDIDDGPDSGDTDQNGSGDIGSGDIGGSGDNDSGDTGSVEQKPTVTPPVDEQPAAGVIADPTETGIAGWLETDEHIAYLHGYSNEAFGPDNNMTRAQAAQMFYNLLRDKSAAQTSGGFSDVPADAWYAPAAEKLAALGVITGYTDGTFRPDHAITRAEFTVIAMRFAKLDTSGENIFSDVSADDWFYEQVKGAVKYGWIGGFADGTFRPQATITRAQVATIVDRMLGRSPDGHYEESAAHYLTQFADVPPTYWAYYSIMEAANTH